MWFLEFLQPAMVAWVSGLMKVNNLGTAEMGKWQGLAFGPQQTKTLPFDLEYGILFQHNTGGAETVTWQALMYPVTIGIATVTGMLTGLAASKIQGPPVARTFTDSIFWHVSSLRITTYKQNLQTYMESLIHWTKHLSKFLFVLIELLSVPNTTCFS
jgi:hypothetical protein